MWNGCHLADEEVLVTSAGAGAFPRLREVVWPGAKPAGEMFPRGLLLVLDLSRLALRQVSKFLLGEEALVAKRLKWGCVRRLNIKSFI